MWYNSYTGQRFHFDERKSRKLRSDPERTIGFEEATELFSGPHGIDQRSDVPEQFRAIGWVKGTLYSVIFEAREDEKGEYLHLVSLWKATKEERKLYEENA
jgi:uncharacterized DUF497 family protein